MRLIKYDQFINAKTGDKTFINELGKEIERASTGYDPENVYDFFRAGKRLDKALMKNPIYRQMKTSFDKAYEEYKKTFVEFRQSEDDRMDHFQQKNSYSKELKVESNGKPIIVEDKDQCDELASIRSRKFLDRQ